MAGETTTAEARNGATEAPPGTSFWCTQCGLPVRVQGDPELIKGNLELGRAVHAGTGAERGPDGHAAAPIGFETTLIRAVREIAEEYPYFTVGLLSGHTITAYVDGGSPAQHFEDARGDFLRARLDAVIPPAAAEFARAVRTARERP